MNLKCKILLVWVSLALASMLIFILNTYKNKPVNPSFTDPDFTVNIPGQALLMNYLTVSVEAKPGTTCRLTFIPPSGEVSVMDTTASTNGLCEWRWKLDGNIGRGHGRLIFTINGVSDTHFIDIRPEF